MSTIKFRCPQCRTHIQKYYQEGYIPKRFWCSRCGWRGRLQGDAEPRHAPLADEEPDGDEASVRDVLRR